MNCTIKKNETLAFKKEDDTYLLKFLSTELQCAKFEFYRLKNTKISYPLLIIKNERLILNEGKLAFSIEILGFNEDSCSLLIEAPTYIVAPLQEDLSPGSLDALRNFPLPYGKEVEEKLKKLFKQQYAEVSRHVDAYTEVITDIREILELAETSLKNLLRNQRVLREALGENTSEV